MMGWCFYTPWSPYQGGLTPFDFAQGDFKSLESC